MTPADLKAARVLLLTLHSQADASAAKRARLPALRTALACVDAVMAATEPVRVHRSLRPRVAPTRSMDLRPTCYGPPSSVARTELMTEVMP